MSRRKLLIISLLVIVIAAVLIYLMRGNIQEKFFRPTDSSLEQGASSADLPTAPEVIAQDLTVPWGIAFLPGGEILVTERSGNLLRIGNDRQTIAIEGVAHVGEGGLLGIALHPNFEQNRQLYLYMTTRTGEGLTNRIERYRYEDKHLNERTIILSDIPGAANHDGGRLAFGPDGMLYVTAGDAGIESLAQDRSSLAGKILRITDEGKVPADNPFGNAVYSYGHRNPQGLAWDYDGQLWSTEHGRSGLRSGFDELNLIKKGANYGWPEIEGDETVPGMERPVIHSSARETWAPASLAYVNDSLFFGGLRAQTLYEAMIAEDNSVKLVAHFVQDYGRLRTVGVNSEGLLFLTTSNTDGRGKPQSNDDRIIKINPQSLNN